MAKLKESLSTEKSKMTFFFSVMEILISRATPAILLLCFSLCYCKLTSEYYCFKIQSCLTGLYQSAHVSEL